MKRGQFLRKRVKFTNFDLQKDLITLQMFVFYMYYCKKNINLYLHYLWSCHKKCKVYCMEWNWCKACLLQNFNLHIHAQKETHEMNEALNKLESCMRQEQNLQFCIICLYFVLQIFQLTLFTIISREVICRRKGNSVLTRRVYNTHGNENNKV